MTVIDTHEDEQILRYRGRQRIIHAVMASSFLILLITGLALVWGPLAFLAAGGWSRYLHRIAAVAFMSVPVLYFILDRQGLKELIVESFTYDKDDVSWFRYMYRYALGRTAEMPPQGRLNAGQKLHHSTVIVFSAVIAVSGLVLWFLKADLSVTMLSLTAMIHDLYALAVQEKDYASQIFLQWFVTEQVEEEDNASKIIETLKMIGDNRQALLMLDKDLDGRFAPHSGQEAQD